MDPMDWILGGGLAAAGATAAKFWSDLRAVKREDKTADTARYNDLWEKLSIISDKADKEAEEARVQLAECRKEREQAALRVEEVRAEVKQQFAKERASWQDDFDRISDKYRQVLRICADQEEEIQHSRIVISKITERRGMKVERPKPAPMTGGARSYDVPVPGSATVTVTLPTQTAPVVATEPTPAPTA